MDFEEDWINAKATLQWENGNYSISQIRNHPNSLKKKWKLVLAACRGVKYVELECSFHWASVNSVERNHWKTTKQTHLLCLRTEFHFILDPWRRITWEVWGSQRFNAFAAEYILQKEGKLSLVLDESHQLEPRINIPVY